MKVVIHVAIALNGVIGRDQGLPWRLAGDLKRFKAATMGKPIVMGRKTWEGLPRRPLPGRLNIVVSRDPFYLAQGAEVAGSLEDAITLAKIRARCSGAADEICVIGGGQIYAQALPLADRLEVTHVLSAFEGDAFFPAIDPEDWAIARIEEWPAGGADSHPTRQVVYERRTSRR